MVKIKSFTWSARVSAGNPIPAALITTRITAQRRIFAVSTKSIINWIITCVHHDYSARFPPKNKRISIWGSKTKQSKPNCPLLSPWWNFNCSGDGHPQKATWESVYLVVRCATDAAVVLSLEPHRANGRVAWVNINLNRNGIKLKVISIREWSGKWNCTIQVEWNLNFKWLEAKNRTFLMTCNRICGKRFVSLSTVFHWKIVNCLKNSHQFI